MMIILDEVTLLKLLGWYCNNHMEANSDKPQCKMLIIESFLREMSLDQLTRVRKDDILDMERHVELGVWKAMRTLSMVRMIVDNNIFEEEILSVTY